MKLCTIKGFTSTYLICFTLVNSVLYSTFVAQNKSTQVQYLQNKSTQVQYCIYKTETVYPEYVQYCLYISPFLSPRQTTPKGLWWG